MYLRAGGEVFEGFFVIRLGAGHVSSLGGLVSSYMRLSGRINCALDYLYISSRCMLFVRVSYLVRACGLEASVEVELLNCEIREVQAVSSGVRFRVENEGGQSLSLFWSAKRGPFLARRLDRVNLTVFLSADKGFWCTGIVEASPDLKVAK